MEISELQRRRSRVNERKIFSSLRNELLSFFLIFFSHTKTSISCLVFITKRNKNQRIYVVTFFLKKTFSPFSSARPRMSFMCLLENFHPEKRKKGRKEKTKESKQKLCSSERKTISFVVYWQFGLIFRSLLFT